MRVKRSMNLSSTTICQQLKNLLRTLGIPILRAGRHRQAGRGGGVAVVPRLLELQLLVSFPGRRPRHNRKLLLTTTTLAQQWRDDDDRRPTFSLIFQPITDWISTAAYFVKALNLEIKSYYGCRLCLKCIPGYFSWFLASSWSWEYVASREVKIF